MFCRQIIFFPNQRLLFFLESYFLLHHTGLLNIVSFRWHKVEKIKSLLKITLKVPLLLTFIVHVRESYSSTPISLSRSDFGDN